MKEKNSFVENTKNSKLFKIWDILILIILLVIIALVIVYATKPAGNFVYVYDEGNLVYKLPLNVNTSVRVKDKLTVVIEDGFTFVKDANCPNKLCEHAKKTCIVNSSITCLPQKISIVIVGAGDLDVVS
ncbi:MAG: NusG domain II-containing protein [Clostridia bacterium]